MSIAYWMVHKFAPHEISFSRLVKDKHHEQKTEENSVEQEDTTVVREIHG